MTTFRLFPAAALLLASSSCGGSDSSAANDSRPQSNEAAESTESLPDNDPWTVVPAPSDNRASIEVKLQDGPVFSGGCNARLGEGTYAFVLSYDGNLLQRIDNETEPVIFEVLSEGKVTERLEIELYYFGPDEAWTISSGDGFSDDFADAIGRGDELRLLNGSGDEVVAFNTNGAQEAFATARQACQSQ